VGFLLVMAANFNPVVVADGSWTIPVAALET
jgi:hypothetical protein